MSPSDSILLKTAHYSTTMDQLLRFFYRSEEEISFEFSMNFLIDSKSVKVNPDDGDVSVAVKDFFR